MHSYVDVSFTVTEDTSRLLLDAVRDALADTVNLDGLDNLEITVTTPVVTGNVIDSDTMINHPIGANTDVTVMFTGSLSDIQELTWRYVEGIH